MIAYLDSSVVLRPLLGQKPQFSRWRGVKQAFSSKLLELECIRVIERYRLSGEIGDEELATLRVDLERLLSGITLLEISSTVFERAKGSFPTAIGSLDSLHLATALVVREQKKWKDIVLVSHDHQLLTAAQALGLAVEAL